MGPHFPFFAYSLTSWGIGSGLCSLCERQESFGIRRNGKIGHLQLARRYWVPLESYFSLLTTHMCLCAECGHGPKKWRSGVGRSSLIRTPRLVPPEALKKGDTDRQIRCVLSLFWHGLRVEVGWSFEFRVINPSRCTLRPSRWSSSLKLSAFNSL